MKEHSSKRCRMLSAGCLITTAVILAMNAQPSFAEKPEASATEIPFELIGNHIYIDGVTVNGNGPFRFMLDTGGQGMGRLDRSVVEKLKIAKAGEVQATDGLSGRAVTMPYHKIDSLEFAGLRWNDIEVGSRNYNRPGRPTPTDGILGIELFAKHQLVIDYPNQIIRVDDKAAPLKAGLKMKPDRGVPQIVIRVGTQEIPADIDTGSMGGIALPKSLVDKLTIDGELTKIGEARTVSGSFAIFSATLRENVTIGNIILQSPFVETADRFTHAIVGGRFLKDYVLTIDQRSQRLKITAPEADGAAAIDGEESTVIVIPDNQPRPRYGIAARPQADVILVQQVMAGMPAAKCGLKAGDEIIQMNGTPVRDLTEDQRRAAFGKSPVALVVRRDGKEMKIKLKSDE